MRDYSHLFDTSCYGLCAESQLDQGGTATSLPAYPMLLYVSYGKLRAEQAGVELTIEAESCALFRAGEAVTLQAEGNAPLSLAYAELADQGNELLCSYPLPLLLTGINTERVHDYIKQLLTLQEETGNGEASLPYERAILTDGLILLLLQAIKQQAAVARLEPPAEDLQRIRNYCLKNLASNISIADLRKLFPVSATAFYDRVKRLTGLSPLAYVRKCRLEHALQLLQSRRKSVKETAAECGFTSPFHFSRTFKKHYGISPSDYRSQFSRRSLSQGDILMRQQRYIDATAAYQKELTSARDTPLADEKRYNLGLAYYCTEEYEEALHNWQRLRGTPWWLKAVPDIIDTLFRFDRFEAGQKLFREHYEEAKAAGVQKTLEARWIRWCRTMSRQHRHDTVKALLQIRSELFPTEEQTSLVADQYLIGQLRGVEVAPGHRHYASALRKSGHYQKIVDSPHCSRKEKAEALLLMGRYQTIVKNYRDFEYQYATALGLLGKAKEGLQVFPVDSEGYAISLFYNGEYDRILADHRQFGSLCYVACNMKKEPERIITEKLVGFWRLTDTLCLLGRLREARYFMGGHLRADAFSPTIAMVEAAQMLLEGSRREAETVLLSITEPYHINPLVTLRLMPAYLMLKGLRNPDDLQELRTQATNRHYMDQLSPPWFQVRLALGVIDDKAYIAQPRQYPDPRKQLPLFQAIRDDLAGQASQAIDNYRIVFDRYSQNMLDIDTYAPWHWYIKWRLKELGALPPCYG